MLYGIYITSSNFPHIFKNLFQLVCFYSHLPCQTAIKKNASQTVLYRKGLKSKGKKKKNH